LPHFEYSLSSQLKVDKNPALELNIFIKNPIIVKNRRLQCKAANSIHFIRNIRHTNIIVHVRTAIEA